MSRYCSPMPSRAARTASARPAPAPVRKTQSLGNQATLGHLKTKLTVGPVDDPLEHEADEVADKVMRMPDPALSFSAAPPKAQRKCAACEEEDKKKLQMKPTATSKVASAVAPSTVHGALAMLGATARRHNSRLLRAALRPGFLRCPGACGRSCIEVGARDRRARLRRGTAHRLRRKRIFAVRAILAAC